MSMNGALPTQGMAPAKTEADYPTRLADIAPGSRIRVGGKAVGGPPFDATVLQTHSEWGSTGEPALYVKADHLKDPIFISQAQRFEVTVLANAADFITDELPADAVRVRLKPTGGVAMRFTGGIENATEIVRWALGKAAPRYDVGNEFEPETMTFGADVVAYLGDWIVLLEDGTFQVHKTLEAFDEEL